jgi:PIN like domain
MRVLIDECLPAGLTEPFAVLGHECETVRRAGYGAKKNGELLSLMEGQWDVLLTNDRNIKYQQHERSECLDLGSLREIEPYGGFAAAHARLHPGSPLDPARPCGRGRAALAK